MSEIKIANRYAQALMHKAIEANTLGKVADDMASLVSTCANNKDLVNVLKNPIISSTQKLSALKAIFKSFDPLSVGLFQVVTDKHRDALLPQVAEAFTTLYNQKRGIAVVTVTSAVAIDSNTENSIKSFIKQKINATEVELKKIINPDIIGGLIIRFGDNLLDTSVSAQINKLKKELNIA